MPTDTERREVARRLRECKRTKDNPTATFDWAIYAALDPEWYKRENWIPYNAAVDRLADLIEPSEPKVRCVAEVKVDGERLEKLVHDAAVKLTGIDRDALLALADEMEQETGSVCGVCMGKTARRIREALGVVDGQEP